jgi:hypothetical protein
LRRRLWLAGPSRPLAPLRPLARFRFAGSFRRRRHGRPRRARGGRRCLCGISTRRLRIGAPSARHGTSRRGARRGRWRVGGAWGGGRRAGCRGPHASRARSRRRRIRRARGGGWRIGRAGSGGWRAGKLPAFGLASLRALAALARWRARSFSRACRRRVRAWSRRRGCARGIGGGSGFRSCGRCRRSRFRGCGVLIRGARCATAFSARKVRAFTSWRATALQPGCCRSSRPTRHGRHRRRRLVRRHRARHGRNSGNRRHRWCHAGHHGFSGRDGDLGDQRLFFLRRRSGGLRHPQQWDGKCGEGGGDEAFHGGKGAGRVWMKQAGGWLPKAHCRAQVSAAHC